MRGLSLRGRKRGGRRRRRKKIGIPRARKKSNEASGLPPNADGFLRIKGPREQGARKANLLIDFGGCSHGDSSVGGEKLA